VAACARPAGAGAGDSSSAGSERSKLENAAGAACATGAAWEIGAACATGATAGAAAAEAACENEPACEDEAPCIDEAAWLCEPNCAGAADLEGTAADFAATAGAAARAGGATGAGFCGSDCNTGGAASPIISKSEPPGFQASDSARKLDAGDFGTSSSDEPMFGKSSNSRMSSIAWGDSDCASAAGVATGAAGAARPETTAGAPAAALGVAGACCPFTLPLIAGFDGAAAAALADMGGTEAVRGAAG